MEIKTVKIKTKSGVSWEVPAELEADGNLNIDIKRIPKEELSEDFELII